MTGYIKDHRKELDSDVWLMPPLYHRTWQWLKYNVNHADKEIPMKDGNRMLIKRGQRLTSIRDIAKGLSWYEGRKPKEPNPKTVSAILEWMEKTSMIKIERGKGNREYTLITLINYEVYNEKESQGNSKVTAGKQCADINNNDNNDNNKKPSRPKSQKQIYDNESIPLRLASYLLKNIRVFKPDFREPNVQMWADDMRKLVELDKKDPKQIGEVIDWVTQDIFWQTNILSAATLRKQWDKVTAKMTQGNKRYRETEKKVVQFEFKPTKEEKALVAQAYANQGSGLPLTYNE